MTKIRTSFLKPQCLWSLRRGRATLRTVLAVDQQRWPQKHTTIDHARSLFYRQSNFLPVHGRMVDRSWKAKRQLRPPRRCSHSGQISALKIHVRSMMAFTAPSLQGTTMPPISVHWHQATWRSPFVLSASSIDRRTHAAARSSTPSSLLSQSRWRHRPKQPGLLQPWPSAS